MKVIHVSLWEIENRHSKINWLVENKFRFIRMNDDEIFTEYCRSFIIWFRNQFFRRLFTCSKSDINTISDIFHSFSKYWSVHQFEKIFFEIVCCFVRNWVFNSIYGFSQASLLNETPKVSNPSQDIAWDCYNGEHSSSYHQELESTSRLYSQQLSLVQVEDHYANYEVLADTPNQPQECNLPFLIQKLSPIWQVIFSHPLEVVERKWLQHRPTIQLVGVQILNKLWFLSWIKIFIYLLSVMESRDLVSVSRPVFWKLGLGHGLEGLRSRLGLEGFRSRSRALRLKTLHRLFFMKFCKKEFI